MTLLITPFSAAAPWILGAEGGFVNAVEDRGGATKYGISLRYLQLLDDRDQDGHKDGDLNRDGKVDVADIRWLTESDALDIYERDFWHAGRCGEMPLHVALCVFDGRVNHRVKPQARLVQQALRVQCDGIIGDKTITAAQRCAAVDFLPDYFSYRARHYADIVRMDSSQAKFERGWYRRCFLLHAYILRAQFSIRENA